MWLRKMWSCAVAVAASCLLALECAGSKKDAQRVQFTEQAQGVIHQWFAKNGVPKEWFVSENVDLSDGYGAPVPYICMNLPREQWYTWLAERRAARVRKYAVRGAVAGGIAGSISRYCSPERSAWWPCACTIFGAAVGLLCSDISIAWNPLVPKGMAYEYDNPGSVWLRFHGLESLLEAELHPTRGQFVYSVMEDAQVQNSFELRCEMDMGRIE